MFKVAKTAATFGVKFNFLSFALITVIFVSQLSDVASKVKIARHLSVQFPTDGSTPDPIETAVRLVSVTTERVELHGMELLQKVQVSEECYNDLQKSIQQNHAKVKCYSWYNSKGKMVKFHHNIFYHLGFLYVYFFNLAGKCLVIFFCYICSQVGDRKFC